MIPPVPKITEVSDRGLITLLWSMDMKQITNLDALVDDQRPALRVSLEPGSSESDVSSLLLINYKVVSFENKKMII